MKKLVQIAEVVLESGVSAENILACMEHEEECPIDFMQGVLDMRWDNDDEAAHELFQATSIDQRYRTLKHKTKRQLLRHLFDLRLSDDEVDDLRNAHFLAVFHSACGQILMSNSAVEAALEEFAYALELAEKFEFNIIGILAAFRLEDAHATQGRPDKQEKAKQRTDKHYTATGAEIKARRLFDSIVQTTNTTTDYTPAIRRALRADAVKLKKIADKHGGRVIVMLAFEASMIAAMMQNNYVESVRIGEETLRYIEKNSHIQSRSLRARFVNHLSHSHLQLLNLSEARKYSDEAVSYSLPQTPAWCNHTLQSLLIALRLEEYHNAAEKLDLLLKYVNIGKVNEFVREEIMLYHGYFRYLVESTLFKTTALMQSVASKFNIEEFLSSSPTFTRDKRGANIPRIILEVLLMLSNHNIDGATSKAEALRKYRQTYLTDARYKRSGSFLKLLHLLIEQDYNIAAVEHKGSKYAADLQPNPENNSGSEEGIEPIVFDRLWEIVKEHVKLLQRKNIILVIPSQRKNYKR